MDRRPRRLERRDRVEYSLVLGDDVAHAAEGHVIQHFAGTRQVVDGDIPQGLDPQQRRAELAGCASFRVPAARVLVLDAGVDDEHLESGRFEPQRDDAVVEAAAVEEHGGVLFAEQ